MEKRIPDHIIQEFSPQLLNSLINCGGTDKDIVDQALEELHRRKHMVPAVSGLEPLVVTMDAKLVMKVKADNKDDVRFIVQNELSGLLGRFNEIDITASDPRIKSFNIIIPGVSMENAKIDIEDQS